MHVRVYTCDKQGRGWSRTCREVTGGAVGVGGCRVLSVPRWAFSVLMRSAVSKKRVLNTHEFSLFKQDFMFS